MVRGRLANLEIDVVLPVERFARGDSEVTSREYKITLRLSRERDGITGKRREFVDVLQAIPVGTTRIVWSRRSEAGAGIPGGGWEVRRENPEAPLSRHASI